jgi:hypothetical protein
VIATAWGLLSWVYWTVWVGLFFAWEIPAVLLEKRNGMLPLTRVIRDRLMRRHVVLKLAGLLVVSWLFLHFTHSLTW